MTNQGSGLSLKFFLVVSKNHPTAIIAVTQKRKLRICDEEMFAKSDMIKKQVLMEVWVGHWKIYV